MRRIAFRSHTLLPAKAKVTLVATGSGDPELLTLQVEKAMVVADVLFVDDLVNPEIPHYARAHASPTSASAAVTRPRRTPSSNLF